MRRLSIWVLPVAALCLAAGATAAPAKKPVAAVSASAKKPAVSGPPTAQQLARCAAVASAVGFLRQMGADASGLPPYPDKYGHKIQLDIVDADPTVRGTEDRGFVVDHIIYGGHNRSASADKARYLISHEEAEIIPAYTDNKALLAGAINSCTARHIDAGAEIDINLELAKTGSHVGPHEADYVGLDYKSICGTGGGPQRNSYVAGIPEDYCERMRPGGPGPPKDNQPLASAATASTATASNRPAVSGAPSKFPGAGSAAATAAPAASTANIDPQFARMSCAQISGELNQPQAAAPSAVGQQARGFLSQLGGNFGGAAGSIMGAYDTMAAARQTAGAAAAQARRGQLQAAYAGKNCDGASAAAPARAAAAAAASPNDTPMHFQQKNTYVAGH